MQYKNIEITAGLENKFTFEILDESFLKVNMTGFAFKFEVFDSYDKLIISDTTPDLVTLGSVVFKIANVDSFLLKDAIYQYRLVLIDTSSAIKLYYKGFAAVGPVRFNLNSNATSDIITLPDGSLYATTATIVITDVWYALSEYMRFLVSGLGVLVIDGRDLRGTVYRNLSVFESNSFGESRWIPPMQGMTAFRIKQVTGTNLIRYLP